MRLSASCSMLILIVSSFNISSEYEFDRYVSEEFSVLIELAQNIIRPCILNGFPKYGVPILDPLQIKQIHLDMDNPEFGKLNVTFYNSTIRGFKRFIINRMGLSLIGSKITANVAIPKLRVRGHYNLAADFTKMYHIYGTGPLKVIATNLHMNISIIISFKDTIQLKNLTINVSYSDVDIQFYNLMNGSESSTIINEVMRRNLPQIIEILKPQILLRLENFLISAINNLIHQFIRSFLNFPNSLEYNSKYLQYSSVP